MNWRELITDIYSNRTPNPGFESKPVFYAGVSDKTAAEAEAGLKATFPSSLRSFLQETDGVLELMRTGGSDWFTNMWVLWRVCDILERNGDSRSRSWYPGNTVGPDYHELLLFADAGCDGISFGFPVLADRVCSPRVVVWHPMGDELVEAAPSLETFVTGWLTGAITV
jgi:hypothetical protein